MKKYNVRLPEGLIEKIDKEAEKIGVSGSAYVRSILIWWFGPSNLL